MTLVDNFGDAGINGGTRFPQVRLTYHDGPLTWAVATELPEDASNSLIPGFGSFLQYDIAGGHQFIIAGGTGGNIDTNRPHLEAFDPSNPSSSDGEDNDDQLGWVVGAGANINLADVATFTAGAQYTQGLAARWMNQLSTSNVACEHFGRDIDGMFCDPDTGDFHAVPKDCDLQDAFGVTAGLTFNINDTTSFNIEGGYAQNLDADQNVLLTVDNVVTAHANILWQPVKQMRLGWEVMWGRNDYVDKFKVDDDLTGLREDVKICAVPKDDNGNKCVEDSDAFRFQFGAWFFF